MGKTDELLVGAIDMHCHGFPEFNSDVPHRFTDEEHVKIMKQAGMRGVVFKSHFWPTLKTAEMLNARIDDFEVFGSLTLNACVGGPTVWAVDAALKQGAKVIWMPTWSAKNDMQRNAIIRIARDYLPSLHNFSIEESYSVLDENGDVLPVYKEIISLVKEYDAVINTCHISPKESLAFAKLAKQMNFNKIVFTHPDSGSVTASLEEIIEMANLGAYIEICALGLMPLHHRITPQKFAEIIHKVGADKCILTTDYFFEWAPPVPEQLRILITALLEVGIKAEEISQMVRKNPEHLLNLE